jgi:hypothetical protein
MGRLSKGLLQIEKGPRNKKCEQEILSEELRNGFYSSPRLPLRKGCWNSLLPIQNGQLL